MLGDRHDALPAAGFLGTGAVALSIAEPPPDSHGHPLPSPKSVISRKTSYRRLGRARGPNALTPFTTRRDAVHLSTWSLRTVLVMHSIRELTILTSESVLPQDLAATSMFAYLPDAPLRL